MSFIRISGAVLLSLCFFVQSASAMSKEECVLEYVESSAPEVSVEKIKALCADKDAAALLPERLKKEIATQENSFVITPHRQNYILPFTMNDNPHQEPYEAVYPGIEDPIDNKEAKLQVSLKVPLSYIDLLIENDGIYFGFTLKSFWQVYNHELSAPFRETNYQPELFYQAPLPNEYLGGTVFTRIGIEHQSNGRSQLLSRSWNRVFFGIGFQKDQWAVYLQPWYRLSEDPKYDDGDPETPLPPDGDDNPDIDDYMGHFELLGAYKLSQLEFTSLVRYNFEEGNGAFEVDMSFPLWGRLKGYVQYFNGYGESLIDYNHQTERIGVGFLLTGLL
ncbi:MAG: phospholipase A [Pseudomonadales bacterium]|nr:phospholipase A [Pseudomonadales bacterium]